MNITGTLPQTGNLKLFVSSLSTQGSTRPKQNIFNVVLMRPDKLNEKRILRRCKPLIRLKQAEKQIYNDISSFHRPLYGNAQP